MVDNAAEGPFLNLHFYLATELLREVTKHNREGHTQVIHISNSLMNKPMTNRDQRKWKKDQELILAKILAQLELLNMHILGGPTKHGKTYATKSLL